jgi:hypothetical protein
VVSAHFVCQVTLYASERVVSGYQCLVGSHFTKRKCQHLSCIMKILVPVRCPSDDLPSYRRKGKEYDPGNCKCCIACRAALDLSEAWKPYR